MKGMCCKTCYYRSFKNLTIEQGLGESCAALKIPGPEEYLSSHSGSRVYRVQGITSLVLPSKKLVSLTRTGPDNDLSYRGSLERV